jgi:hypothetical protein
MDSDLTKIEKSTKPSIAVNTDVLPLLVHIPKWALLPELNLMGTTVNITP